MARARGLSLTKFADEAGIRRGTLYKAFDRERDEGSHRIDTATAEALARAGNRSLSWVMSGEETVPAQSDAWYDEGLTMLIRKGLHASDARRLLDELQASYLAKLGQGQAGNAAQHGGNAGPLPRAAGQRKKS
jgi:transcriptional regulator with XRE-family HTH domain